MNVLPFNSDMKITEVLSSQKFTLSAEVIPPRNGSDQGKVLHQIQTLVQSGAEFLAVTKGAGGSLRGGSLPIAQAIKEKFSVPCIAHFTCRDLTPFEVENHLMDHHYFGIRNVLALRGDPPDGQSEWHPREGGYHYAYQLIEQIRNLNDGVYFPRPGERKTEISHKEIPADSGEKTDFCIGAAAYPDYPNLDEQLRYFQRKVQAGAEFGITDMLFDPESYAAFMDHCQRLKIEIPVLPGTRLLKSKSQALKMQEKFKVKIPAATLDRLPESSDLEETSKRGLELFVKLVERLKGLGAPGIHLYVIADTLGAAGALTQIREALGIEGK